MRSMAPESKTGFTLVEVIITLLVAVILGAIMMQYSGSALTKAARPSNASRSIPPCRPWRIRSSAPFGRRRLPTAQAWSIFQSSIGAAGTDQNNAYGEYRVLFNDFIQFDAAGNEIADVYGTAPEDTLKVVIAGANDDSLTFLLVR
jgi:prepilin-type N-terminal cleavage/methylation domain-containing protein